MLNEKPGKKFEKDFVNSISPLIRIDRLNDSKCNYTQERNAGDFIIFNGQIQYHAELKSTNNKSISMGETKGFNIKEHQITLVDNVKNFPNCLGVFVLNYRKEKETYIVPAYNVNYMYFYEKKKSINIDDCKICGFKCLEKDNIYDLSFFNPKVDFQCFKQQYKKYHKKC